jgi:hypothetical protein
MSAPTLPDRERFESLAPSFVAGTLQGTELEWFVNALAQDNAAQHSLNWHQAFADQLRARYSQWPANKGLDVALARIARFPKTATASSQTATAPRRAPTNTAAPQTASWGQQLLNWLFAGGPRFSPALAALALIAVVPALVLFSQTDADTTPPWSEVRSSKAGLFDGPLLRVNFKPGASEADIRALLTEQGALAIGPTRLGDWYLKVRSERNETVLSALRASQTVTQADVVSGLPEELLH